MPLYPEPGLYPSIDLYPDASVPVGPVPTTFVRTTFTEGVLDSYSAWANVDSTNYLAALCSMFEQVFGIVVPQGDQDDPSTYVPGWSTLLNVTTCPTQFLPFLSQFNGTNVQPGTPDAVARMTILAEAAQNRGTLAAMTAAAKRNLVDTQFLILNEREAADGQEDAYHVVIEFKASECPSEPALVAAVEAQKPAGIQVTYLATEGFTWNVAQNMWSADEFSWTDANTIQP